jgi:hypothetical protein
MAGTAASCSSKNGDACATPNEGCECASPGQVVECGDVIGTSADSVTCRRGSRACDSSGHWGACVGGTTSVQSLPTYDVKGLGTPVTCVGNPCDPYCQQMVDNGAGLDAGPGTTSGESGVSIYPAEGSVDVDFGPTCTGIACSIDPCAGNPLGAKATTIHGVVYDPAGYNPIYNAVVYVPNAPLTAFTEGATCDACVAGSGSPIVTTTTDATGAFTLAGVPSGTNIPIVIQIGKWRRKYIVPSITKCVANALASDNTTQPNRDALPTRLPRTNHEFTTDDHIPKMAIATGSADPFECLLLKMGISSTEFQRPADVPTARVHYYKSNGIDLSTGAPAASTLWASTTTMNDYDIIFLPCEGSEIDKGAAAYANAISYTSGGGRLFTTHYSYVWMQLAASPFNTVATWNHRHAFETTDPVTGDIDTSFPKGAAFATWLNNVGAATGATTMSISQPRWDSTAVNTGVATEWMQATSYAPAGTTSYWFMPNWGKTCASTASCPSTDDGTVAANYQCARSACAFGDFAFHCAGSTCTSAGSPGVIAADAACGVGRACYNNGCFKECIDAPTSATDDMKVHFTFNTPIGATSQCGRVVYSDFHVSAAALSGSTYFPASCVAGTLSSQEKALEFMVFDLSSCVSPDIPPTPPPPPPPYPSPVTFTRDYDGACPVGTKVVWRFFDYQTVTPSDSSIVFNAQTASTAAGLGAAPSVALTTVTGPPITTWTGVDVGAKLVPTYGPDPTSASQEFLRVTITLNPSTDEYSAPTLTAWRQNFDCVPSE